jgi:hypothetical protein
MDDTDFYLKVSETFSEIMRQVRFYPYPAVLYKIAFNKFLNGETPQPSAAPLKRGAQKEKEVEKKPEQISPSPSLSRGEKDHTDKENSSLTKEGDHEVVEDLKKSD